MNSTLILVTTIVEYLILVTLFLLSIWSITIIIDRKRTFAKESLFDFTGYKKLLSEGKFSDLKSKSTQEKNFVFKGIYSVLDVFDQMIKNKSSASEGQIEEFTLSADRRLSSYIKEERIELEKGLSVLATLGSNAAFIGLFGTVLGIIRSFAYLGNQSGSQAVMSGVSQALYATAIGLFVAIPAVVAYNIYTKKIKNLILQTESLKDELVTQVILNNRK